MPDTWQKALDAYQYQVRLADFKDNRMYPGWFKRDTGNGDRACTMEFEDRFRKLAPDYLEAWYEVVFWKLSFDLRVANEHTPTAISNIERSGLTASDLLDLCHKYIGNSSTGSFKDFRKHLFGSGVATAATFPAFIDPENFPMVDIHIERWAKENSRKHIYKLRHGNIVLPTSSSVNNIDRFVIPWYKWCRITADLLSQRTDCHWRARDVEMAVFTAQRSQKNRNPWDRLKLKPLT